MSIIINNIIIIIIFIIVITMNYTSIMQIMLQFMY